MFRYRTGDMVTLSAEPCACGRDTQPNSDQRCAYRRFCGDHTGPWIPATPSSTSAGAFRGLSSSRCTILAGSVRVLLAPTRIFPPTASSGSARRCETRLASDEPDRVEIVPEIDPAPSGKYRPWSAKLAERLRAGGRRTKGVGCAVGREAGGEHYSTQTSRPAAWWRATCGVVPVEPSSKQD